jgi:hypothetical protein
MTRRFSAVHLLVSLAKAFLISWALIYLVECFGWHLLREAGGRTVSAVGLSERQSPRL